jgi:hypothetical protein
MWGSNNSSTRTFDRLVGIFVTLGVVITLGVAKNYVKNAYNARKEAERKQKASKGDATHNLRWRNTQGPQVTHNGMCHCQRVHFRIRASRTIYAVDVPSKVRFPRLSIPASAFEALSDESAMSLYAVCTSDGQNGFGVHTFCSYCGVHVVFAPTTDPTEIQVNVDCLDKSNVDAVLVSYMAVTESTPVQVSYEPARPFNRRGAGAGTEHGNVASSTALMSNMYMLDSGSFGFASPIPNARGGMAKTPTMPRGRAVDPYASGFGLQPTSGTNKEPSTELIPAATAATGLQWLTQSPYSRTKQIADMQQHHADNACESYLDTYNFSTSTGDASDGAPRGSGGNPGLGPYGGVNAQGQYDHPLYRADSATAAMAALYSVPSPDAPQWNRYYSGAGGSRSGSQAGLMSMISHLHKEKESVDGEVKVAGFGGLVGLSPSPLKPFAMRSFPDSHKAAMAYSSLSPAGLSKQLDSMKAYLAHYPNPGADADESLPSTLRPM